MDTQLTQATQIKIQEITIRKTITIFKPRSNPQIFPKITFSTQNFSKIVFFPNLPKSCFNLKTISNLILTL